MFTATPESTPDYLREKDLVAKDEPVTVTDLLGGVSCRVLKVVTPSKRWVIKQALPKLRVAQEWLASPERMEHEEECIDYVSQMDIPGAVPEILHRDRDNHLCIMTCAAEGSMNWKELLLSGQAQTEIAASAGFLLGCLHQRSYGDETAARHLDDKRFFHELRLDPFYGRIAELHPKLADKVGSHGAALASSCICFVHGDYSPKNILVNGGDLFLVDFEVGHFGHPSFDLGFMLAHLTLKTIKFWKRKEDFLPLIHGFWAAYNRVATFESESWHERSLLPHLGCVLLARLDGKSPVDYVTEEADCVRIRALATSLILREVPSMRVYLDVLSRAG